MLRIFLGTQVLNKYFFPFTTVLFIQILHHVKMIKNENESRKEGSKRRKSLRFGSMASKRGVLSDRFRRVILSWLEINGQRILEKEEWNQESICQV